MEIRSAKIEDAENILKIDRHIKKERLNSLIERNFIYVLASKNEIKGILRYSLFWQEHPFLDLIFLTEDIRNQGFGTLMMDKWETDMKNEGFGFLITSTQENESAYEFYEKRGYINKGGFFPPMQEEKELIYVKEL